MALFGLYKTKHEIKEEQKKQEEELQKKQMDAGLEMYAEMWRAARENKQYNVMQTGKISDSVGPAKITQIPQNGDNYSIFFDIENKEIGGPREYTILQVDINLKQDKIHRFDCPYGPDTNFSFEKEKTEATKKITEFIKQYTLFPK
ncbi:MAG: hypothetical protein ACLFN8_04450 [Candidatus Woesearchaeota archaeon]